MSYDDDSTINFISVERGVVFLGGAYVQHAWLMSRLMFKCF